jgi:outer membrane protein assembly factor BamD
MTGRLIIGASLVAAALGSTACASSGTNFAAMPPDSLFDYALERIRADKLDDASTALERFTFQYPTHPRYQEARFRLAETYFERDQFISAVAEYSRLASEFPAGPYADDARFKVCDSYYQLSPRAPLDQQYTVAAIDHCQSLLAYYPDSPFIDQAETMVTELREKLATKVFDAGKLYTRLNVPDAAIIYFEDVLERFPNTSLAPAALYELYEIYRRRGYTTEAQQARERLLDQFPESPEARRIGGDNNAHSR